ncbi:phosphotyrosine protein phosphatase [Eubacterium oxidoreducens]|uniref:arsenate reductase/protein-tyrosine-phosphatase family protein n=1 Tax=Eubacterium oxidoreducens TaxID=1732 RepID=UPI003119FD70
MKRIIFVCHSGTCRAPMAMAIFSKMKLAVPVEIMARGLVVLFPEPLNQKAEAVMISNDLQLEDYQSRQLTKEDLTEDTLVFTMQAEDKQQIIDNYDFQFVHVLTEYVGDELEIMDPYGGSLQSYGLCFETLTKSLQKLADKLNDLYG